MKSYASRSTATFSVNSKLGLQLGFNMTVDDEVGWMPAVVNVIIHWHSQHAVQLLSLHTAFDK